MHRIVSIALTGIALLFAPVAHASSTGGSGGGSCNFSEPFNQTWKAKYQDILKCYMKGMDPPLNWRPGAGTGTVEGTRGASSASTSITAWRAPEDPPIAGQSASSSAIGFSSSFPSFPGWASGGGSSGGTSSGTTITCPSTQTSGTCTCSGVTTIAGFKSHECTASPATGSSGGSEPGLCTCTPNSLTGTLTGTGTTDSGAGTVSGTLNANLASPNNVSGNFTGVLTLASGERLTVTATFSGTMDESGNVSGSFSGTATSGAGSSSGGGTSSAVSGTVGGSVSSSGAPIEDDRSFCSVEGDRVAMTDQSLSCGGAIPAPALQNRIINLMDNPYALGLIDADQYWFHYFEKDVANKRYRLDKKYPLPAFLCRWETVCNAEGVCEKQKVKDIDIPPPLAQTFSYNRNLGTLYVKLKTVGANYTLEEEFTIRNKVLRVPIVGNKPYVPKDDENKDGNLEECDLTADYYVNEPANTDFFSTVPFYEQNCDRGQFFLPASCSPKILMYDKDNPTIIAPQESNVSFFPVQGRNEVMVSNSKNGYLMIRYPSLLRLGGTGSYYFPDGATVKYIGDPLITQDNQYLWMQPPATVNANSTQVTMPGGGWLEDVGGNKLSEFTENATTNVNWGVPLYVLPQGIMELRSSMDYPTYRNSYIRNPISPPEE